jgi:hypothetical protein
MAIRRFERLTTPDENLNRVQERVEDAILPIAGSPIIDGQLIQNQSLASGTTSTIAHNLGRSPLGYIVVKRDAAQHVYDVQSTNSNPGTTLLLTAGGTVTVDLWVF